jgi:hypothetical protein
VAITIDQIKNQLPQTGLAKLSDAALEDLKKQAEDFVESSGSEYTADQEDILVLNYACYLSAIGLQNTNMQVDPYFFLDAYKLALKQIAAAVSKDYPSDGVDKLGIITIGRLTPMPDFNGGLRKWK